MKQNSTILAICAIAYFFLFSCAPRNQNDSDLIHIDVSRSYPVREINLAEIAKIEFLQLEMHDDFLFRGNPRVVTENKIIFGESNGDILVFSRDGRPLSRFNRRGQGSGEFVNILELVYDEMTDEIFVRAPNGIMVYSSAGKYKRTMQQGLRNFFGTQLANFDADTFLLYNAEENQFSLISKNDGNMIQSFDLPRDERIMPGYVLQSGGNIEIITAPAHRIVRHGDGFLLTDFALDTVFFLSQNRELSPILTRSPAIQSMNTITLLNSFVEAGDYQFVLAVTVRLVDNRLPRTYLMRNKQTGSIYRQRITFDEFEGREINLSPQTIALTQNSRLGFISLDLTELQDANDEGRLSGRLKEIVENSEEDGNNVFMLLHFK